MAINEFITKFGGGYRPNKYKISMDGIDSKLEFLCRAASIPERSIGKVNIPYMGKNIPVAGDRAEIEWTVTIFVDNDFKVLNDIEDWHNSIAPIAIPGGLPPIGYLRTADVDMLDKSESTIRSYKFGRIFPISIGEISLNHDSTDEISTVDVTFAVTDIERI